MYDEDGTMGFEMVHDGLHVYRSRSILARTSTSADTSIVLGAPFGGVRSEGMTEKFFVRGNHMYIDSGQDIRIVTELDPLDVKMSRINIGLLFSCCTVFLRIFFLGSLMCLCIWERLGAQEDPSWYTNQLNLRAEVGVDGVYV